MRADRAREQVMEVESEGAKNGGMGERGNEGARMNAVRDRGIEGARYRVSERGRE